MLRLKCIHFLQMIHQLLHAVHLPHPKWQSAAQVQLINGFCWNKTVLSVCVGVQACQDSLHAVCLEVALKAAHEGSEAPESFSFIAHDIQDG